VVGPPQLSWRGNCTASVASAAATPSIGITPPKYRSYNENPSPQARALIAMPPLRSDTAPRNSGDDSVTANFKNDVQSLALSKQIRFVPIWRFGLARTHS